MYSNTCSWSSHRYVISIHGIDCIKEIYCIGCCCPCPHRGRVSISISVSENDKNADSILFVSPEISRWKGWKPLPFQSPAIHHARTNRDRKAKTPSDPVIGGPVISSHCRSIISVAGFHLLSTLVHYATGNFCLADKLVNIWIATGKAGVYWEHRLSNYADANNETVYNSQPNSTIFVTTFIDNLGLCPWSRKWFNINDVIFYDITTQWGSNNSSHCQ